MSFFKKNVNKLKYGLLALLLSPFLTGFANAADDLLRQMMQPAVEEKITIDIGKNVNRAGQNVFEGGTVVGGKIQRRPSLIVKITRFLLTLVVALSVTMILYNGMVYIIQTGQGKEGKSLVKNVVYIVIGILISLFSITIITLLQSVSTTLEEEAKVDWSRDDDDNIVYTEDKKGFNLKNLLNL